MIDRPAAANAGIAGTLTDCRRQGEHRPAPR
jgi:hypothetical protein